MVGRGDGEQRVQDFGGRIARQVEVETRQVAFPVYRLRLPGNPGRFGPPGAVFDPGAVDHAAYMGDPGDPGRAAGIRSVYLRAGYCCSHGDRKRTERKVRTDDAAVNL